MLFKLAPPLTALLHTSAILSKNPSHSLTSTTRFKLQTRFAMKGLPGDRSEIAFFDVETTVPTRPGQRFAILEFGAILVCPKKLEELYSYSELVRPSDLSLIISLSDRCNGIAPDAVASAPTFADIAEKVFDILHGRIWAGHNIVRFDCVRIREAFAEIGRPAPEPKGTIDSLALLTQRFGRRAGDMKMASLATYFGLGQQTHRSLDDVRMNLEVLKHCATVLFLESSLPNIFTANSWVSPNATTRSRSNDQGAGEDHPIFSHVTRRTGKESVANIDLPDPFDMGQLSNQMETNSLQPDVTTEEKTEPVSPEIDSTAAVSEGSSDHVGYIEPDDIAIPSISTCLVPLYPGSQIQRIKILHGDVILQLRCSRLKVRFGISTKFVDNAGRPRLNFVVDASPSLCRVLDACDSVVAQKLVSDSGSRSEWRPVLNRKNVFVNYPTARLHIPTVVNGDVAQYATEICQKEASGATQTLVFSKFDAAELDALFKPGTFVDAYLSLDPYDYQQTVGIRLVAKRLVIHSE